MKKILYFFLLSISLLLAQPTLAQIKVRGGFVQDSLIVGDKVLFYLTAHYPENKTILFPDSTYNYAPFEYIAKRYSATQTKDSISYDSAIYELTSFEIDSAQFLRLPVFQINTFDSTFFYSATDTLYLKDLVTIPLPDTLQAQNLPLKTNTIYQPVHWLFNYPVLLIVISALLVIAIIGWLIFGKTIKRNYQIKKITKAHQEFIAQFTTLENELNVNFSKLIAEQAASKWKNYLEGLDTNPYTKFTVKELSILLPDAELIAALKQLDAAVYGNNVQLSDAIAYLKKYAENIFQNKLNKLAHGKYFFF
jgi:hypothetical protein